MEKLSDLKLKAEERLKDFKSYRNLGKHVKPLLVPVVKGTYGHINVRMLTEDDEQALFDMMVKLSKNHEAIILVMDAHFFEEGEKVPTLMAVIHTPKGSFLKRIPYKERSGMGITPVELDWIELTQEPDTKGFFLSPYSNF